MVRHQPKILRHQKPVELDITKPVGKAITVLESGGSSPVATALFQQTELVGAIHLADPELKHLLSWCI